MNVLRRTCACAIVCLLALSVARPPVAAQGGEPAYDVVIRNGRVLDGAGRVNPALTN
jgi:hypothetical protein